MNPYAPEMAVLEKVIVETPTIRTFVIRPQKRMPFRAGQFIQLTVPGLGEAPFTPSSSPAEPERLEVTVLRTGRVTDVLHCLEGDWMPGLRGPFGKGYPVEKLRGKEVLVVGGGVGLAPLRSLLYTLFEDISSYRRVSIKYGARTPEDLLYRGEYERWRAFPGVDLDVTVDLGTYGWTGTVGVVTKLLEKPDIDVENAFVFSCGPGIMLKFVTQRCLESTRIRDLLIKHNRRKLANSWCRNSGRDKNSCSTRLYEL